MTKMTMLSAAIILSAAVAAPVFAQGEGGPGSRRGLERQPRTTHHHRRSDDRKELPRSL